MNLALRNIYEHLAVLCLLAVSFSTEQTRKTLINDLRCTQN